jgi:hypothetical protein
MTETRDPIPMPRGQFHFKRGVPITREQRRMLAIPDEVPRATPEQIARRKAAETAPPAVVPWRQDRDGWHAEFDGFMGRVSGSGPFFWIYIDFREGDCDADYEPTAEAARLAVEKAIGWAIVVHR